MEKQPQTQISCVIPQEVEKALREIVHATGGTLSSLVREILADYTNINLTK